MDKNKQREEFEAEWFRDTGEKLQYEPALSGYRYTQPNTAFYIWQAAQKAALASIEIEPPKTACIGWVKEAIHEHDEKWKDAITVAGLRVKS